MLGFIFGVLVGLISGGLTYEHTGTTGTAVLVGVICFVLGWLFGLFVFTDGDFDF